MLRKNKEIKRRRFETYFLVVLIFVFVILTFYLLEDVLSYVDKKFYVNQLERQENYFRSIVKEKGVDVAFELLKERYEKDIGIRYVCHDIAHFIGRAAAEKYKNMEEAFSHGDGFCWSGYYHGIIEKSIVKLDDLKDKTNSICSNFPGKENQSFGYYSCLHGLGHAAMSLSNYELFDSLEICNMLNDEWERQSCYSGVFMENTFTVIRYNDMKYLNPDNPHFPCDEVENKYKSSCYIVQSSYMLEVSNYDYSEVFEICSEADDPYDEICYQSLGRDIVDETQSNVEKVKKLCLIGKDFKQESNCVIGAVQSLTNQLRDYKKAEEFCGNLPQEFTDICVENIPSV